MNKVPDNDPIFQQKEKLEKQLNIFPLLNET